MKLLNCLVTGIALAAAPLLAQDLVAVRAGKILTMTGNTLEDAVILIENGKITQIGRDLEVPWNATVVDASQHVVAPTWVLAHSSGGMSGSNEIMANVPFLTVQDAVDPSSDFFDEALRNGIGAIHVIPGHDTLLGGQGMIVRPFGKTVEDMTVRTRSGLKLSLKGQRGGRIAQIRQLRNVLEDAADAKAELERQREEFAKEKAAGATDKEEFDGEIEPTKQPIVELIDGELVGWLYVPSAAELPEVARLQQAWPKMRLTLVLGPQCYKAADRVAALGLPVVLDDDALEYTEEDPETGERKVVSPAKILADAGVRFAISVSPGTSGARRYPWWQMATLVRHGMTREAALATLSTIPAQILGIDGETGSIEPGKVANLQILTGDPLQATTWVEKVLLDGEVVYERAQDRRLMQLFGEAEGEGSEGAK